jgi:hypothetical protein
MWTLAEVRTLLRDHPATEQIMKHGYPREMMEQPEHNGVDVYGTEILREEEFVVYDGEVIAKENLERFLSEELGFEFKTAI